MTFNFKVWINMQIFPFLKVFCRTNIFVCILRGIEVMLMNQYTFFFVCKNGIFVWGYISLGLVDSCFVFLRHDNNKWILAVWKLHSQITTDEWECEENTQINWISLTQKKEKNSRNFWWGGIEKKSLRSINWSEGNFMSWISFEENIYEYLNIMWKTAQLFRKYLFSFYIFIFIVNWL